MRTVKVAREGALYAYSVYAGETFVAKFHADTPIEAEQLEELRTGKHPGFENLLGDPEAA